MTLRISGLAHLPRITNLVSVTRTLITVACVFGFLAGEARAQDARTVYARLPFNVEDGKLYTGACLRLTERAYPSTPWWETAQPAGQSIDRAFKSVIAAMKNKDRAALLALTDSAEARDISKFDTQANAYFSQLQSLQLVAVPRAYTFDGLVVFFAKIQSTRQTAFVPFVFAYEGRDTFGFLPSRSNATTFKFVDDWFAPLGSPTVDTSVYCTDSDVKRATHRVSLTSSRWEQSALFLAGQPLESHESASALTTQVKSTLDAMKTAFRNDGIDELLKHMTPLGGDRMKQWFVTASKDERDRYKKLFIEQKPFFVFDESPLIAVYTRTPTGVIQVLYFTVAPDAGQLVWTNSAYMSVSDRAFKAGPVFAAASSAKPFSALAIR
jgi:hypothetical protein